MSISGSRVWQAALGLGAVALMLVIASSASAHDVKYVWPEAYAEERLELDYRWVDRAALAAARRELSHEYLIGDPEGIRQALRKVQRLQQGLSVDRARCLGVGRGWLRAGVRYQKHLRCRLDMSDNDLNFATVRGVLHVLGPTKFKFVVGSAA